MTAEVVTGVLQISLRTLECRDGLPDFRVRLTPLA
jgi:hypothetical protein